jgi:cbb3-type cytochrome oxidase cytochrome c subunit
VTAQCLGNSVKGIYLRLASAALAATAVLIVALPYALPQVAGLSSGIVAGNPKAGLKIFVQNGCAHCHPLFSEGGRGEPNLALVV